MKMKKIISSTLRGTLLLALVVALGLIPIMFACLTACKPTPTPAPTVEPIETPQKTPDGSEKKGGSETTPVPTTVPTQTPEPTATPAPTATPIPEGWYIDPRGIIPPEVEIVVPDGVQAESEAWCITDREGKPILQQWTKAGLRQEWELPEIALHGYEVMFGINEYQTGGIYGVVWLGDAYTEYVFFYQDIAGRTLSFVSKAPFYTDDDELLIGTSDGKAIWYHWGDDYYQMHDFGSGAFVETVQPPAFAVNGIIIPMSEIPFVDITF